MQSKRLILLVAGLTGAIAVPRVASAQEGVYEEQRTYEQQQTPEQTPPQTPTYQEQRTYEQQTAPMYQEQPPTYEHHVYQQTPTYQEHHTYEQTPEGWTVNTTMVRTHDNYNEHLVTPIGAALQIGGGVSDFTGSNIRGATNTAGDWLVRAIMGTRTILGAEVAYVGTAQDIHAIGLDNDAILVRNGVEGAMRLNMPVTNENWLLAPYIFGGIGWNRFDLVNDNVNVSAIRESDDIFVVPFGGGFNLAYDRFTFDTRFTYRPAFDEELFTSRNGGLSDGKNGSLDSWSITAAIGAEF